MRKSGEEPIMKQVQDFQFRFKDVLIFFHKVPSSPSTLTRLTGVFKFVHFGERFQKVPFSVTVNVVLVWTEGQSGKKVAFSNLSGKVWTTYFYFFLTDNFCKSNS